MPRPLLWRPPGKEGEQGLVRMTSASTSRGRGEIPGGVGSSTKTTKTTIRKSMCTCLCLGIVVQFELGV